MNPWVPVAPCTPATCLFPPGSRAAGPRRALRLVAAVLVVLAGVALALAARGLGTTGRIRLTSAWSRLVLRAVGVRVEVRQGFAFMAGSGSGPYPVIDGPSGAAPLAVANHVSWLDPLVMAAVLPCRVLAKHEVRAWPVIGLLAAGAGALFIDRERLFALPEAVGGVAAALADGHPVAAFPEGTTWCGRGMGSFRPAVFQAALDAGAPVRPVAIRYLEGEDVLASGPAYVGDDLLWASIRRVVAVRRLTVEVTMLPAVRGRDRRELAWAAESSVASVLVAGTAHGLPVAA
ncbi:MULTISPECIES: lysophospholipid acyltransferase family protein [unclassified Streptosporangium]|uniref:lysophospholipid acyltransferase family protein n=1 Tax=unclassified Streptosporangium TaxID=2632669 RepID=UPI002E2AB783|nr:MULTISPECIES: 1-acyl-sn-glycerol-3-phosphate acyltransferase [unclassified Streptosporangium]